MASLRWNLLLLLVQLLKKFGIEKKEFEKSESWNFIIVRKCKQNGKQVEGIAFEKIKKKRNSEKSGIGSYYREDCESGIKSTIESKWTRWSNGFVKVKSLLRKFGIKNKKKIEKSLSFRRDNEIKIYVTFVRWEKKIREKSLKIVVEFLSNPILYEIEKSTSRNRRAKRKSRSNIPQEEQN